MLFKKEDKGRIILLDWGIYTHRAIYAYASALQKGSGFITQAPNMCLAMIISNLCKIGVTENDTLIIAKDSPKGSWRKQYKNEYKADRGDRKKETEEKSGMSWDEEWAKMNELATHIDLYTPIHSILIDHVEADDIMAFACKHYSDKEVILVTYDCDLEQMWHYGDRVRIFSQHPARKLHPWKIPPPKFDALTKIAKEIGSKTHNNLSSEVLNERDYEIKRLIIDMINLPEEVTNPILNEFEKISLNPRIHSKYNLSKIGYGVVGQRFPNIYKTDKIITYEKCVKKMLKAKKKRR